jgi:hypothetical protein
VPITGQKTPVLFNCFIANKLSHCCSRCTLTLINLANHLLNELNFEYVLFVKFQTDPLEECFSQYRYMSGQNYHIALQQILESEKKLQILSLLKLKSAKWIV